MKKAIHILKVIVGILVVYYITVALHKYGASLWIHISQIKLNVLLAALALLGMYQTLNAYGWGLCLRSLAVDVRFWESVKTWWMSEALRWLPGSIWGYLSRVAQAKKLGVSSVTASLSVSLELILTIAAWGTTAGIGILAGAVTWRLDLSQVLLAAALLVTAAGAAFVTAYLWTRCMPTSLVARKISGLTSSIQTIIKEKPNYRMMVGTYLYYVILCTLNGVAFFTIANAVTESSLTLVAAIGMNALAWLIGFVAIGAPAGLGVREAGIAGLLTPVTGLEYALLIAVLWRFSQILIEFTCIAAGWLSSSVDHLPRHFKETEKVAP